MTGERQMVMKQSTWIFPILDNRNAECTEGGQDADGAQVPGQATVAMIWRPAIQPALEGQGVIYQGSPSVLPYPSQPPLRWQPACTENVIKSRNMIIIASIYNVPALLLARAP